jgi:cyclopropane-fatty-acyl-phospholipid synthase
MQNDLTAPTANGFGASSPEKSSSRVMPGFSFDVPLEKNLLPDWLIRLGIRRLLNQRLCEEDKGGPVERHAHLLKLINELKQYPIAIETKAANEQHYEVPPRFFQLCLGSQMKYSSGLWEDGVKNLDDAEDAMLKLTCKRAQLADGQNILELGCGWGSLSLWMAEHFPTAKITGVSNSATQKTFIESEM